MEFCPSDLTSKIREGAIGHLDALRYFFILLGGLLHMHTFDFVHRNLKTKNIFIGKDGAIKIGDFGLAS